METYLSAELAKHDNLVNTHDEIRKIMKSSFNYLYHFLDLVFVGSNVWALAQI